ncbi:hypothetical protein [Streptomyces triticirhizae]|uniref:Uncharacterized protein n=1 Tax=Streptomyces triticirhizae TaxID=2483353 RepID=A0A3M2LWY4_9ACTN|nr:hypothetical protein [Streptomyces triticirhizae]RMI39468.1 hypothetical protein EBN88_14705 [Streptomyces triticirhizae]
MVEVSARALAAERDRLVRTPENVSSPPELACLTVRPAVAAADYERRLREVLAPTLTLAATADFEAEELPTEDIPGWFRAVSTGGEVPDEAPEFALAGRARYQAHPGTDGPWELTDWLSRFEPGFGMRGWAWWDLTGPPGGHVLRIWVDSGTESWFAHLDLLWLAYTAGASTVEPPRLVECDAWAAERGSR